MKQEILLKNFYKNLPVLITGGAGFIGSHIAQKLSELGAKITIIDNLSTGNIKNLDNLKGNFKFINSSITNINSCLQATYGQKIIFHLAAFISVPESICKPDICHEINVNGTFNVLEAARINKVKRVIFSSSAAVYGPTEKICSEELTPDPKSPYATTKLIGEYYCKQYSTNFGLETAILRYFNVYGQRQNPNGAYAAVVARFTELIKNNKPIAIFGDGLQTRDFVPVEIVADANLCAAMLEKNLVNGQIFNIGTGNSITLLELISMIKKKYPDYNQEISFLPARDGDIKFSYADCSKYKNITSVF